MVQAAAVYENDPRVRYVEPNYIVHALVVPNDPMFLNLWGMQRIRGPEAWDRTTGNPQIVVAVIDTGIRRTHEDLAPNMWANPDEIPGNGLDDDGNGYVDDVYGWDFVNNDNDPNDDHFHGTHVAGTIGAVGNNGLGVVGVNWNVKLVAVKFLSASGSGTLANAVRAVDYTIGLKKYIRLTNNSWGGGGYSQALKDAIDAADAAGQLFIAAAGNSGSDNDITPTYPSSYDSSNIIAVASIANGGVLSGFSCYGKNSVDIAAPGSAILSTWNTADNAYNTISGTSMATPHVAGACALIWGMQPSLTHMEVRNAILKGAAPNPNLVGRVATDGELDLVRAMEQIRGITVDRLAYRSDAVVHATVVDGGVPLPISDVMATWQTVNPVTGPRAAGSFLCQRIGTEPRFAGTLQLVTGLNALHGDELTLTYIDSYGITNSVTVPIDDVPPVISNVQTGRVSATSVTVIWQTDEPASSWALASRLAPPNTNVWVGSGTFVGYGTVSTAYQHTVTINGLRPMTRYLFAVKSEDPAGNVATYPVDLTSPNIADYPWFSTLKGTLAFWDDMEAGVGRWVHGGLNDLWEHGRPRVGPGAAFSGEFCWGTKLDGLVPARINAWLLSQPIFVGLRPKLQFMSHGMRSSISPPMLLSEDTIEVNAGSGWEILNALMTLGPQDPRGWRQITLELPEQFENRTIQIRFRSNSQPGRIGWFIDDVLVTYLSPPGLHVVGPVFPVDDDPSISPANDGDGYPEAGETFFMRMEVHNSLGEDLTNVVANVDIPSPGAIVLPGFKTLHYGTVLAADRAISLDRIKIAVTNTPGIDEGSILLFHTARDLGGRVWEEVLALEVGRREGVQGRVTTLTGSPIAGAAVTAQRIGRQTVTTTTRADGTYRLSGLVANEEYFVFAGKPGEFVTSDPRPVVGPATGIDFQLGRAYADPTPASLTFEMSPGETTNFVIRFSNENPLADSEATFRLEPTNMPAGLRVDFSTGTNTVTIMPGQASDVGVTFTAGVVPLGTYQMGLRLIGRYISTNETVIPVTLTVDGKLVTGRVTDLAGVPIARARVRADSPGLPTLTTTTLVDGTYTLNGLFAGRTYSITASLPGSYLPSDPVATVPPVAGLDFRLGRSYCDPQPTNMVIAVAPGGDGNGVLTLANTNSLADTNLVFQLQGYVSTPGLSMWFSCSNAVVSVPPGGTYPVTVFVHADNVITGNYSATIRVVNVNGRGYVALSDVLVPVTIQVAGSPIPWLTVSRLSVRDEDGDGYVEPGETVGLRILLRNEGWDAALNTTGIVEFAGSSGAAVTSGVLTFPGVIDAQKFAWSTAEATIQIDAGTPVGAVLPFTFTYGWESSNAMSWVKNYPFQFTVQSVNITFSPTQFVHTVQEGREVYDLLTIQNHGSAPVDIRLDAATVFGVRNMEAAAQVVAPEINWAALTEDVADPTTLIVRYKDGTDVATMELASALSGDEVVDRLRHRPACLVRLAPGAELAAAAARYATRADVLYVEPNWRYKFCEDLREPRRVPNDPRFGSLWGLDNPGWANTSRGADIDAPEAWYFTTGSTNVIVAVLDSGMDVTHPDLVANLWVNPGETGLDATGADKATNGIDDDGNGYIDDVHGANFTMPTNTPGNGVPYDVIGHGTHVAGTIGAVGNNGEGVVGVNWNVRLMACKIGDTYIDLFAAAKALEYAVDNGARFSNNSWGGYQFSQLFHDAVTDALSRGHMLICAAGNDGVDTDILPHYPSSDPSENILSVAASDWDDLLAWFSNFGRTSVDIAAPGVNILSTVPPSRGTYDVYSGTSMAAPHVTGVAALLAGYARGATWRMIRDAILAGAVPDPRLTDVVATGGHLSAFRALNQIAARWIGFTPSEFTLPPGTATNVVVTFNKGGQLAPTQPDSPHRADILIDCGRNMPTSRVAVAVYVLPGPVPRYYSARVDDAARGDGDGFAEPGEDVDLYVTLFNSGSDMFPPLAGTLACSDPNVTIIAPQTLSWPAFESGDRMESTLPQRVVFGPGAGGTIAFGLTVTDGVTPPWSGLGFELEVAPRHSITGLVTDVASGVGVSGATVEYFGAGAGSVLTDSLGRYRIDGLGNGRVVLRASKNGYGSYPWTSLTLSGGNVAFNMAIGTPSGVVTPSDMTFSLVVGVSAERAITVTNVGNAAWSFVARELVGAKVALISDAQQLVPVAPFVQVFGATVTVYNDNLDYFYSALPALLGEYNVVVADLTGADSNGRKLYDAEITALTMYVANGGKLILTGPNLLGAPDNPGLAQLVGSSSYGLEYSFAGKGAVVADTLGHGMLVGPFVQLVADDTLGVTEQMYDKAQADGGLNACALVRVGTVDKIIYRRVGTGAVVYWSGNREAGEWVTTGVLQDLFKNIVYGLLAADVSWLQLIGPTNMTLAPRAGSSDLVVRVDSTGADVEPLVNRAAVLLIGNLPGMPDRVVTVTLTVQPPTLIAISSTGVVRWNGTPLDGDGGANSCLFQLIYAGPNGVPDVPGRDGRAGGDDVLLRTTVEQTPFSRIGRGYESRPDFGLFREKFSHDLPVGARVFVRAWDAPSFAQAVAYGDSTLYTIQRVADEAYDFGTWVVGTVPGYPSRTLEGLGDKDGDSIPDGWSVRYGLDPRNYITPLATAWKTVAKITVLNKPTRIAVWSNFVFVAEADTGIARVSVLRSDLGAVLSRFGSFGSGDGQFRNPRGLAVDPVRSRLIVADTDNNRIVVLNINPTTGALSFGMSFGTQGSGMGQFNKPSAVAVSATTGRIVVADTLNHRIQIFDSAGLFVRSFGSFGAGAGFLNQPKGVCADSATGRIFVADTENNRVQCFTGSGTFLWQTGTYGTGAGQFIAPHDVQLDVGKRMYVVDRINHRVQVFDSETGTSTNRVWLGTYGGYGSDDGQLWFPEGVAAVATDRLLYVADTQNKRIQLLRTTLDVDGDGMDDVWEDLNGLNWKDSSDWNQDPDGDGIINIGEFRAGTRPQNPDTDNDGVWDGDEMAGGYDPRETYDLLAVRGVVLLTETSGKVHWLGKAGGVYLVQYRDDLLSGIWLDGGYVVATDDGILEWTDNALQFKQKRFYRVIWLNK
ncbi:MAG: S8 family serine peptidase [Kiritimatiellia bacterium]